MFYRVNSLINVDISYHTMDLDKDTKFYKISYPNGVQSIYSQFMTGSDHAFKAQAFYNQNINDKIDFIVGLHYENISSIPAYANDEIFGKTSPQFDGIVKDSIEDKLTIVENKYAVFGQISYRIFEPLSIIAGARYEISERYDESINPRISLNYTPSTSTSVKLIYGSAFQAPSLFYQYEQFGTPSIVMLPAKSSLKNQTVNSSEIELTQKIGDHLMIDLSVFYNKGQNLIQRVNLSVTDTAWNKYFNKYTKQVQNQNIGEQSAWGVQLHGLADIKSNMKAYFNYTYTDATFTNAGTEFDMPRVAKHKANLGLSFINLWDRLTFTPSLRWVGEVTTTQETLVYKDDKLADSYLYLNLSAQIKITNQVEIYTNLYNILNDETPHVGVYTRGVYTDDIPQAGFTLNAGLRVNFGN